VTGQKKKKKRKTTPARKRRSKAAEKRRKIWGRWRKKTGNYFRFSLICSNGGRWKCWRRGDKEQKIIRLKTQPTNPIKRKGQLPKPNHKSREELRQGTPSEGRKEKKHDRERGDTDSARRERGQL